MKALLIGASGFLGRNLYQAFDDRGYEVAKLSFRPHKEHIFCDNLKSLLLEFKPDCIINAASSQESGDNPKSLIELNSSNILLNSFIAWGINTYHAKCSLITFGSYWQYRNNVRMPFNAYAASKSAAECMLEHYVQDGLKVIWFFLSDTYGQNDTRNKIVNSMVNSIKNETQLNMTAGEQYIDLIHISDVSEAVIKAMNVLNLEKKGSLKRFSLCSFKPIKVNELINIFSKILQKDISYLFNLNYYEYSKRQQFIIEPNFPMVDNWKPNKDLKEGLSELLN